MEDRILPWSQVKVISGLSRTTVWRLQKTGDFPASVQVSPNRVGWWQSEILEWRRSRLPRRLPEPRRVPSPPLSDEVAPRLRAIRKPESTPVEPPPENEVLKRPAGKRKRNSVCEQQTAFDFGG
ncbi:AlpA family phage regulatory protein [Brevundimonas diminuta]|nr:AlpA family phage regulatory protein [Brevundimonas diminuta]